VAWVSDGDVFSVVAHSLIQQPGRDPIPSNPSPYRYHDPAAAQSFVLSSRTVPIDQPGSIARAASDGSGARKLFVSGMGHGLCPTPSSPLILSAENSRFLTINCDKELR
jgi:hypothetical protein